MEQFEQNIVPSQEQPQYQAPIPEQKHFMNKKFIVTFIILVLLGATAYGGIWWWGKQSVEVVVPTFTPTLDPTADWQTYRNEEYGFEFKYPNNWIRDDEFIYSPDAPKGIYGVSDRVSVSVYENNSRKSLTGWIKENQTDVVIADKGNVSIAEASAHQYVEGGMVNYISTYITKEIVVVRLSIPEKSNYLDTYNQILATFKFIEPEVCIQVITPAKNPQTGEARDFPTPCDVPEGWVKI